VKRYLLRSKLWVGGSYLWAVALGVAVSSRRWGLAVFFLAEWLVALVCAGAWRSRYDLSLDEENVEIVFPKKDSVSTSKG
jgi:hypothetical protein